MPGGDKVRVLIVDDVADTRENVRRLLQFESDIEVVGAARTAQEGIQLTSELDPDVILMDINMPDMDGIAATETIRQRSPLSQVVILSVQGIRTTCGVRCWRAPGTSSPSRPWGTT